jgi:hypothetical protein
MPKDDKRAEPRSPARAKRPYVKPAFRAEHVFETTALACGKSSTEGQCHIVIKRS